MKKILYLCFLLLFAYFAFLFLSCETHEQVYSLKPPDKVFICEQNSDCVLTSSLCSGCSTAVNKSYKNEYDLWKDTHSGTIVECMCDPGVDRPLCLGFKCDVVKIGEGGLIKSPERYSTCFRNHECVPTFDLCGCKVGVNNSYKNEYDSWRDKVRSSTKFTCMKCDEGTYHSHDKETYQFQCIDGKCEAK